MRSAFTFIELVFVVVIMGILANFGTNILMTTYTSYTASTTNNKMLANVELTLKQISNRLQYRIKDSVIVRNTPNGAFTDISAATANSTVLEWIGYDIDGWLGSGTANNPPNWSGFIDIDDGDGAAIGAIDSQIGLAPYLESPGTDTVAVLATINALSNGGATNPAIFFTGANSNVGTGFGWDAAVTSQTLTAHPITSVGVALNTRTRLQSTTTALPFTGVDIYENYKLAWTAYSISLEDFDADGDNDLVFTYDYQPWAGAAAPTTGNRRQLLLQNVDTFRLRAIGETIMLRICVNEDALGAGDGGYSLCEETAIF